MGYEVDKGLSESFGQTEAVQINRHMQHRIYVEIDLYILFHGSIFA